MKDLVFYTINPHYKDYSLNKLVHNFRLTLQKYYKQSFGPRYHKHKDKQFPFYIFQEETKNAIKEPHLHIIIEVATDKRDDFFNFINQTLIETYHSLTFDIQPIKSQPDLERIITYCTKEDNPILGNEDLY